MCVRSGCFYMNRCAVGVCERGVSLNVFEIGVCDFGMWKIYGFTMRTPAQS